LGHIEASLGTPDEPAWVQVARMAFELPLSESDFEKLERLCEKSEDLKDHLGAWILPVRIDSPEADSLREQHRHFRRPVKELPDRAEEMDGVIEEHLLAAERGEKEGWWRLNYALLFDEHGREEPRLGEWEADLTALPGWKRSSPSVRTRILHLARPALDGALPDPEEWFGKTTFNRGAFAGYRALSLLAHLDRSTFDDLPTSAWECWMPIVVDFPNASLSEGQSPRDLILRRAVERAGASFAVWCERKLVAEAGASEGHLFFLHSLGGIKFDDIEEKIVPMLADRSLRPTSVRDLLDFSLPRFPERSHALTVPRLVVDGCEFETDETREAAVISAAKLLAHVPGLAYSDVRGLFDRCPELGRDVILGVAREERSALVTELGDWELCDLVTWIFEKFPESDDPPLKEGYVSPRESLRDFRQWLLDAIAERGTDLSVEAINAIHEREKTATLRFALRKARDTRRAKSPAPSPGEVVRLVQGERLAPRTQADLLSRVAAVLESIQSSLQIGQPPAAPELWNTRPTHTPKDEGELSNWLSRRLSSELGPGFDVGRERLVSGGGKGRGKSVDLQIVYPAPGGSTEMLQILVEVKCCWEPGLSNKIRTQLAEGYMATIGVREGIFLLFWFGDDKWDEADYRRRRCAFISRGDARRELDAEAMAVNEDLGVQIEVVVFDGSLS
jgi:hypothetical protein